MARLPRFILPGIPHHVTQQSPLADFFEDGDYALYLDLLAEAGRGRVSRSGAIA